MTATQESLAIRVHGDPALPTLIYLPGLHGDWTLVTSFRAAVQGRLRFVEFTYPRTTQWSLADYAEAILAALQTQAVPHGWLLGESFGSQVAWAILDRCPQPPLATEGELESASAPATSAVGRSFQVDGLILAGGFVRHPTIWGVRLAQRIWDAAPLWCLEKFLVLYRRYAWFRHRRALETLSTVEEFLVRRTEQDRLAISHRLQLIAQNDPRPVARRTQLPVYYLAGAIDPLVPWPAVRLWLRRNCPGYGGGKTFWSADHNVLGTTPRPAARQTCQWLHKSAWH